MRLVGVVLIPRIYAEGGALYLSRCRIRVSLLGRNRLASGDCVCGTTWVTTQ
jgi:hypothetical protein